jgi:PAS domain S-box-containing protein/diguanylate cyclase (GGDEF)-like protein
LQLNQELYRNILESLPCAVYLVDRERRIAFWNGSAEEITGYLGQAVIGRYCHDNLLMHCDENDTLLCGVACPLLQTMHDGQPREADLFLRHKDGQRVPVRVRAVPIRNEHGSIIGAAECFDERACVPGAGTSLDCFGIGASIDPLTDLPDRTTMLTRIRQELDDFKKSGAPFGILNIAIDNLDHLRHMDGRNAVKAILRVTAQTLTRNLGPNDLLGLWSEERFLAVVANCTEATLLKSANILKRLVSLEGVPWWGERLSVTLSAGGTVARTGDTAESLVDRARKALENSMLEHGDYALVA